MRAARDILEGQFRAIAALAIALALLSTPVQCALVHGPHSLFVPASAAAATVDHAHDHHGHGHGHGHDHAAMTAGDLGFVQVPAASAADGQNASAMPVAPVTRPGLPAALAETAQPDPGRHVAPAPRAVTDAPWDGRLDAPPEPPPP